MAAESWFLEVTTGGKADVFWTAIDSMPRAPAPDED